MSTTPVKKERTIFDVIEAFAPHMERVLPKFITADRFTRILMTCIRKTPKLKDCTQESLLACCMTAAELGLEPGSALQLCSLIPYKTTATFIIEYKGMVELVRRNPQVKDFYAEAVYKNDKFKETKGTSRSIFHEPAEHCKKLDADLTHTYSVCEFINGGKHFEVMNRTQIDKIKKNTNFWRDHFAEMARKTVIRRIFKYLPKIIVPPQMFEALEREDTIDIKPDVIDVDVEPETPELEATDIEGGE